MTIALCIGCGCDDLHACWDEQEGRPCHWLRVDRRAGLGVCSACGDELAAAWDAGDRTLRVPVEQPGERA